MNKIWILTVLFVIAGCKPDAQQSPSAPVAKADAQEKPASVPVAPAPQKAPAMIVAAAPNEQPVQPKPTAGKSDVASPPLEVRVAEPAKAEAAVVKVQVPVATPAPQGRLSEADAIALAKKKNCFACHTLDKKAVGPAWRAVAQKYRGDAGAQAVLEAKVRKGGKGNWGSIAMPPQPALSDAELTGLVQFVQQLQ